MITADRLRQEFPGITGQEIAQVFKILKNHKDLNDEEQVTIAHQVMSGTYTSEKKERWINPGTALYFLMLFEFVPSTVGTYASNSEKRRLLENQADEQAH